MRLKAVVLFFSIFIFISCKKKDNPTPPPSPPPVKTTLISNFTIPAKYMGDADFQITKPTSNSPAALTYISDNSSVATIKGDTVQIKGVGSANITVKQEATGQFSAASTSTQFTVSAGVFISGYLYTPDGYQGFYCRNGVVTTLAGHGMTHNIVIQNDDIYVCGSMDNGAIYTYPGYWKNGEQYTISKKNGEALAMAVSGKDVYVAGITDSFDPANHLIAKLWKNGKETVLKNPFVCCGATGTTIARGIAVHDGTVYVSGTAYSSDGSFSSAMIWRGDGSAVAYSTQSKSDLTDTTSTAYAIQFSGNDLYVCGSSQYKNSYLTYWKNGVPNSIINKTSNQAAYVSMAIDGSDVYIGGNDDSNGLAHAAYWKNGKETILATNAVLTNAVVNEISIQQKDIYIVGVTYNSTDYFNPTAVYWLNGTIINLPVPNNAYATGITVLNH